MMPFKAVQTAELFYTDDTMPLKSGQKPESNEYRKNHSDQGELSR